MVNNHWNMNLMIFHIIYIYGSGSKPWYPFCSHQNSWVKMDVKNPLKMVCIGIDPYPYHGMYWYVRIIGDESNMFHATMEGWSSHGILHAKQMKVWKNVAVVAPKDGNKIQCPKDVVSGEVTSHMTYMPLGWLVGSGNAPSSNLLRSFFKNSTAWRSVEFVRTRNSLVSFWNYRDWKECPAW